MLFSAIAPLIKTTTINLTIVAEGDDLRVIVQPKPKTGEDSALFTPLSIVASPEELDEKFTSVLCSYRNARESLSESLDAAKTIMEAAAKTAREKAASKSKPSASKQAAATPSCEDDGCEGDDEPTPIPFTAASKPVSDSVEMSLF